MHAAVPSLHPCKLPSVLRQHLHVDCNTPALLWRYQATWLHPHLYVAVWGAHDHQGT